MQGEINQNRDNPIEKEEQIAMTCFGCHTLFTAGEELRYFNGKVYHPKCYRKSINKSNGRPFECPKCKGEGTVKPDSEHSSNMMGQTIQSVQCNLCSGNGYTEIKFVPVVKVIDYVAE